MSFRTSEYWQLTTIGSMKRILILALLGVAACSASATVLFSDNFNYSNGSLSGPSSVSGGNWYTHSATATQTGQVDVASSRVNLTGNEAEDVSAQLAVRPYHLWNDLLQHDRQLLSLARRCW